MGVDVELATTEAAPSRVEDSAKMVAEVAREHNLKSVSMEIGIAVHQAGAGGNSANRGQTIRCYICNKVGHIAKDCLAPKRQGIRGRGGGQTGRFPTRVSTFDNTGGGHQQEDNRENPSATGYTENGINAIPTHNQRASPFHGMRKRCGVH